MVERVSHLKVFSHYSIWEATNSATKKKKKKKRFDFSYHHCYSTTYLWYYTWWALFLSVGLSGGWAAGSILKLLKWITFRCDCVVCLANFISPPFLYLGYIRFATLIFFFFLSPRWWFFLIDLPSDWSLKTKCAVIYRNIQYNQFIYVFLLIILIFFFFFSVGFILII